MKIRNSKKGQAMVETAIILPLILMILMGIVDFGMVFNNYLVINNATREAARAAVVGSSDTQVMTIVSNMTGTLDASRMSTSITPAQTSRKRGDQITVTITYNDQLITPIVNTLLSGALRIRATTIMRME